MHLLGMSLVIVTASAEVNVVGSKTFVKVKLPLLKYGVNCPVL